VNYDENGFAITTGSSTTGQTHYSSYLFADSLEWINQGWLDYIMPQSYWAITHPAAGYHNVMGWWDKVVKFLPVNLYSGIGVYMANSSTETYSWKTDNLEFVKQLNFLDTLENTQGFSIYSYNFVRDAYFNSNSMATTQMNQARTQHLTEYAVLPELKSMDPVRLPAVSNVNYEASSGTLSFDAQADAKFYYIYRSTNPLTYESSEIIDVISNDGNAVINWLNDNQNAYYFGVRALSYTNHLSPA